ncbi:phosphomannomutase [Tateyamaria sp. syn59]|uniref:phosphomannomutase n=1 Tax=Tateyamaria sp. syn59 TaxID=2576942 RepID=UPI0011BD9DB1
MTRLSCFKSYDIRGRVNEDLTEQLARDLGEAVAQVMAAKTVVIGQDARADSPRFAAALAQGLNRAGVDVLDLGLCGTEEVYFGTDHYDAGAGIMVTASHNPIDYNGFKLVGRGATPLPDKTFRKIEAATATADFQKAARPGSLKQANCREAYVARVLSFVDPSDLDGFRVLANAGNGAAGPTFDAVVEGLSAAGAKLDIVHLHHTPNATFPNGIPNPLLPENQPVTANAVLQNKADAGLAWDGDFDRCFFFDEKGAFIPGEYIVGALADAVLARSPFESIVHDPRVLWNTQRIVAQAGGTAVASKTGHALIKAKMRETGAVYGGEMSAHHYFRDFMYCDSGMIPWVLLLARLAQTDQSLSALVADMRDLHPSSGEINFRVTDAKAATAEVERLFTSAETQIDRLDGLSLTNDSWRLNLRASNTEPLLRLNIETRQDGALLEDRVKAVTKCLEQFLADTA